MPAVGAGDVIIAAGRGHHADGHCLLTDGEVAGADKLEPGRRRELVVLHVHDERLEGAHQEHRLQHLAGCLRGDPPRLNLRTQRP